MAPIPINFEIIKLKTKTKHKTSKNCPSAQKAGLNPEMDPSGAQSPVAPLPPPCADTSFPVTSKWTLGQFLEKEGMTGNHRSITCLKCLLELKHHHRDSQDGGLSQISNIKICNYLVPSGKRHSPSKLSRKHQRWTSSRKAASFLQHPAQQAAAEHDLLQYQPAGVHVSQVYQCPALPGALC